MGDKEIGIPGAQAGGEAEVEDDALMPEARVHEFRGFREASFLLTLPFDTPRCLPMRSLWLLL